MYIKYNEHEYLMYVNSFTCKSGQKLLILAGGLSLAGIFSVWWLAIQRCW